MPAAKYDITCEQGATFRLPLTWRDAAENPIDLTGYTAKMQVRASAKATDVVVELSTTDGRIAITPLEGRVVLQLSAVETAVLPAKKLVYDLELTSPTNEVVRLLEGALTVSAEVTR